VDGGKEMPLHEWLAADPVNRCGDSEGKLPFLLKVLSIAQPLSIQAHPDKELAERLHASKPDIYKDPNHKPEIAIALSPFEALCGFQPIENIKFFLEQVPEFRSLLGEEAVTSFKASSSPNQALKSLFQTLFTKDKNSLATHLSSLITRLKSESGSKVDPRLQDANDLLLKISELYPGDVGNWCVYLLNHLRFDAWPSSNADLTAQEEATVPTSEVITRGGLFMGPNEPHSYLGGDIIECMACSDNVVRAGLTPKLIDAETLCSMLTYQSGNPDIVKGNIAEGDDSGFTVDFVPPVNEFRVERIQLDKAGGRVEKGVSFPSMLLCVSGAGKAGIGESAFELKPGAAFYVTPGKDVWLLGTATQGNQAGELVVFRVRPNLPRSPAAL
jgi:mannose-6-phosphate isomerase